MRAPLSSLYKKLPSYRGLLRSVLGNISLVNTAEVVTRKVVRGAYVSTSTLLVSFCVANTGLHVIGYPACIEGASMKPFLNQTSYYPSLSWLYLNVDWVFVNLLAARSFEFERGEVVVFVSPKDPHDFVIKRLVGLEGDIIADSKFSEHEVVVPKGHCWLEGDNESNSIDSNNYGPVPLGLIFAKASHIIWPPERWQSIEPNPSKGRLKAFETTGVAKTLRISSRLPKVPSSETEEEDWI